MLLLLVQIPPGVDATFNELNFTGNVAVSPALPPVFFCNILLHVHRVRIFNALCFLRM
jgi:hypothetical protein